MNARRSRVLVFAAITMLTALGTISEATAQEPRVLFRAVAGDRPKVLKWVDTPDRTFTDPNTRSVEELFAGTTWLFLDNLTLLIRRGSELIVSAHYRALDDENSFWALHNRREYALDGSADRDLDDPRIGGATLYITEPGENGTSITVRVELQLTFEQ